MAIKMLVFDVRDCEKVFFDDDICENFDITLYSECLNDETLKKLSQDELDNTMVISVFLDSDVSEKVINSFKNLRIISTRTSSMEHINKKAAADKNITIVNVEGYTSKTAAQYTIGVLISLVRNLIPLSKFVEEGKTIDYTGFDVSNLTLGVIGTGSTGAEVCRIAECLGMKTIAYDIVEKKELLNKTGTEYVNFETVLKESDVVTLHLPYTIESKNLITKKDFDMMKDSSYLINISRPEIVNLKDLYNALINKKIKGAALDIRVCESVNPKCIEYESKTHISLECFEETKIVKQLSKLQNVIITPNIAYKTSDVMEYILKNSIKGVLNCIKGGNSFTV